MLILIALLPRMAQTQLLRFTDPFGDHPAYSRYDFVITPDDLEVLYGESLDLSIEVRGPAVEQLELVMIPPKPDRNGSPDAATPIDVVPAFPSPSGTWQATIADITQKFDLYCRVRRAHSRTYPVRVITVPRIEDVRVEVTPPLYTGQTTSRGPAATEGIHGLQGTHVRVIALSNRPLSAGSLSLVTQSGSQPITMTAQPDPHEVAAEFEIKETGRLELYVVDAAGQSSTDELADLLDRIEEHATSLPDAERLDPLRQTAQKFVRAVRESGAGDAMLDAEAALARFSGSQGHTSAKRAAELLEQFLSQCQGMGNEAGNCLPKFSPGLGSSLQQTLQQLVPGMGMNQGGAGLGQAGSGGYSSRAKTMQNVGMYGRLPLLTPGGLQSGASDSDNAIGTLPGEFANEQGGRSAEQRFKQSHPSYGTLEWGIAVQYRRPAGRYLQRLAEEMDEQGAGRLHMPKLRLGNAGWRNCVSRGLADDTLPSGGSRCRASRNCVPKLEFGNEGTSEYG